APARRIQGRMDLRYIAYSGGNFLSCQPASRAAVLPRRPAATAPSVAEAHAPSPAAVTAEIATVTPPPPAAPPTARVAPPTPRAPPLPNPPPEPRPAEAARPVARAEPAPALAPQAHPVPAQAVPNNFDLVSVDDVHFEPDQPEAPPVDVRDLSGSG